MVFKTIKKGLNFGKNALVGGLTSRSSKNNNAANSGIL